MVSVSFTFLDLLAGFPEWTKMMDSWGAKLLGALKKAADLLAIGLRLPENALSDLMENGPHLLGPTGKTQST